MAKQPAIPPENRNPHESEHGATSVENPKAQADKVPKNPDKHGQQANSKQNTTHQGYQQDR
jgi:hypothetical protein